jgi:hypothetical protein
MGTVLDTRLFPSGFDRTGWALSSGFDSLESEHSCVVRILGPTVQVMLVLCSVVPPHALPPLRLRKLH